MLPTAAPSPHPSFLPPSPSSLLPPASTNVPGTSLRPHPPPVLTCGPELDCTAQSPVSFSQFSGFVRIKEQREGCWDATQTAPGCNKQPDVIPSISKHNQFILNTSTFTKTHLVTEHNQFAHDLLLLLIFTVSFPRLIRTER